MLALSRSGPFCARSHSNEQTVRNTGFIPAGQGCSRHSYCPNQLTGQKQSQVVIGTVGVVGTRLRRQGGADKGWVIGS